jgi:hypothetical protein
MELVVPVGETPLDELHHSTHVHRRGSANHEMQVVRHDHPGEQLKAGVASNLTDYAEEHPRG